MAAPNELFASRTVIAAGFGLAAVPGGVAQLLVVRPTMRPFIRNHYLPLWLHRIACGIFAALMLALSGMTFLGQADGSWRHLIALCLIVLSVPAGIICACIAHRFSIVEGLAGDVGYEDLDEKHDDKPKPSA